MEWQSIETAPTYGEEVLVYYQDESKQTEFVSIAHYCQGFIHPDDPEMEGWWVCENSVAQVKVVPTYWMPFHLPNKEG